MHQTNTATTGKQPGRATATKIVAGMTRPEGMGRVMWMHVQRVLIAIAQCYPKAWPSQRTLCERLDMPERSLQRYIATAQRFGLLTVEADAGTAPTRYKGTRTNRYHLNLAAYHAATLAGEVLRNTTCYSVETSSQMTSSSVPHPAAPSVRQYSPRPKGSTVVDMQRWREEHSRDVGDPAAPALVSKRKVMPDPGEIVGDVDSKRRVAKKAPKPPPEWKRLGDYFEVLWQQMQQTTGRHKDTRGLENYRMVRTYCAAHFADKSELEVRKMMEEFVTAVSKRTITVKPGQSGWLCFTGAWGRQRHTQTGDRYAAYREEMK